MSETIVLITGSNTGLGYATVKALSANSEKQYKILLGGRSIEKAKAAAEELRPSLAGTSGIDPVQIDIEDDKSIEALVKEIESSYGRIDVLVNNAGAQFDHQIPAGKMTLREVWDKDWSVNTTSTFVATHALVPLLLKSSDPRLLFIASGTSTLAGHGAPIPVNDSPPAGWPKKTLIVPAYRSSKTGMNMMMLEYSRILKNDGVKVWCVSPGYLATGLGPGAAQNKQAGAIDPAIGAALVRSVIEGKRDGDVGKVVNADGIQPW